MQVVPGAGFYQRRYTRLESTLAVVGHRETKGDRQAVGWRCERERRRHVEHDVIFSIFDQVEVVGLVCEWLVVGYTDRWVFLLFGYQIPSFVRPRRLLCI